MDTKALKQLCQSLPKSTCVELGGPSNIMSYLVHGKKFAYFKTSAPEKWRFSFRATPERFLELTDQPGIKPARYMHRFHWVTVVDVRNMNEEYLKELVCWSYEKAISSLPKKIQKQISI
ncbi:MAG: MmcQ/YjbR family DNA-binding protein [Kangiellaceae bacterium]|nr:MmcQ/YjbR family DNA-binding protein [Kangiellaceae bacterium]